MKYIVKSCPCYTSKGGYYDCWANQDTWCENITDCVIKQAIEKCMHEAHGDPWQIVRAGDVFLANDILKLFDIEEINK